MTTDVITDPFGRWSLLGSCNPDYYKWVNFGIKHQVNSGTYKLIFQCSDFNFLNSFAWMRSVYEISGEIIVSPSIRVYPKPQHLKLEFPLPKNLVAVGVDSQYFELKKVFKRYKNIDKLWSVELQELILDNAPESDNAFFLTLENVSYARDPQYPNFYISTFTERVRDKGKDIRNYEVGRFYTVETDEIFSDPQVIRNPYELVCIFTQRRPIQPGELKVRVIY